MNCAELERVKNSKSTEEINNGNPAHVNNDITLGFGSLGCIIYKYHYHKYHRRLGFSGERRNALTACANRASLFIIVRLAISYLSGLQQRVLVNSETSKTLLV